MELSLLLPVLAALEMFPSLVSPSDPPSAPKLFLHPRHQEFIEGDRLTLRCSAQGVEGVTRYQFFDGSGKQLSEMPPNAYREAWLHLTANNSTIGAYSCAYWREESGKEVTSIKSSPISIQVKGNLSRVLAVGGSFFTLNGLIFLATYFLMKHQDSRTVTKRRLQRAKPVEGSPKSSNPDLAEILSDEPTTPPASVFPVEKQDT
ncbi:uncharacterized protein LOC102451825 isoform X2 [Pelodiscus sinensis]|uniref:uncharacterized protein LOC102451825 isoform X2 n=1 Tax=Pelodiscus sinensis TaxID=13735 RepID=UPI003F6C43E4